MQIATEGNGVSQFIYNVSVVTSTGYSIYSQILSLIITVQPHQLSIQKNNQKNLQSIRENITIINY